MNNPLVDEIQALSDCRSHAERAEWLLSVPLSVLSHYEMTIRNRLRIAGFHIGIDYLELELGRLRAPRRAGQFSAGNKLLPEMVAAAESEPTPWPYHGVTEV